MPWSSSEDESLRRMWAEGRTVSEIAQRLGKPTGTVKTRRVALGLAPRRQGNLQVKVRVGFRKDTLELFRLRARRDGQTIQSRIRALIDKDLGEP